MQSVKNISFKSDSNLLKKVATSQEVKEEIKQPQQEIKPISQAPIADTFESKKEGKTSYLKEYSGVAALAISALGIPITYAVTKKANTKAINKLQTSLDELSSQLSKLNIDEKIQNAIGQAAQKTNNAGDLVGKKTNLTTILLGIGSGLGISKFLEGNKEKLKEMGYADDDINEAGRIASEITDNSKTALTTAQEAQRVAAGISGTAASAKSIAEAAQNTANSMDERVNEARNRADEALGAANAGIRPEMQKFVQKYYDLWIMQTPGWAKRINNQRTEVAMSSVRDAAVKRLDRPAKTTLKEIKAYKEQYKKELTSLWALTAEFKPIKLGGLGDVPVDLQDNFTKLGIDNPIFIPMYETPGKSKFVGEGDIVSEYIYDKKTYNLQKLASTEIEVFKNGTTKPEKVDFYMANEDGKKIIFVRNESFKGSIYESTALADEPEKFAVFNKAVYTLAKAKVAEALGEPLSSSAPIIKYQAYDNLKAPNSMILNDWHAASMAGLLRYKAPLEYNYNEMNKKAFEALSNMPLLMIGHNLKVQGASNSANSNIPANNNITQNIINTLYDKHAIAIVENAHSGLEGEDMCNTVLLKRATADKQFNSLFHGIALADWFVPVSKNYANEIVDDVMQSGIAKPLLERRKATGTIEGIINGTDLIKHDMNAISSKNYVDGLVLETYNKNNHVDRVMELRRENKKRVYNMFIKPILTKEKDQPELIGVNKLVSEQEFLDAPLISFAHRLTDQKGLSLLKGAIFRLFDNWEQEFGDKPKPYFIVGGPPEDEKEVQYLYDLKNPEYGTDKSRLDHVIAMKGNMPNPALMAASTFFCAPSTFEPCGLTQGESFAKGTPVIVTDVGGYHDTVKDGVTGILAKNPSEDAVYDALVRALKTYYFDHDTYKQMVMNDLNIDFSWARAGKEGPIYEYTDKLGFNRKKLPDIATTQAA
ncbi:MAG: glycosyltransferase [Cyanobacteria bacterium SIG32]|nr:glycosyltransferase [Cyanobacteria bacterium SIG32]